MKTIVEVYIEYSRQNESRYKNIRVSQAFFCLKYLEQHQNKEFHQFHKDLNRIFMDNKDEVVFNVSYSYEKIFPKKKNIGAAMELISAVFNSYVNQGK